MIALFVFVLRLADAEAMRVHRGEVSTFAHHQARAFAAPAAWQFGAWADELESEIVS